jgi:hypothetical protein
MTEVIRFSETLVLTRATQGHIPKDGIRQHIRTRLHSLVLVRRRSATTYAINADIPASDWVRSHDLSIRETDLAATVLVLELAARASLQ